MSADVRPLDWDLVDTPAADTVAGTDASTPNGDRGRTPLRPVPDAGAGGGTDTTVLRDPARMLVVQQQLNGAATLPELFGRASELARTECGFDRAIILTVESGALCADRLRALEDPASDRLRRALLAEPLELRPGSAESEFIRFVEAGRGEPSSAPSLLRRRHGLQQLALGAIMPEDTVLAVLVLDRQRPALEPADRVIAQGFAQMVTHAFERQLMRQRITNLASELRYMIASSNALLHESLHAPMQLDGGEQEGTTFGQMGSIKPQTADQLRELFTKREWTVAKEIIAGKSNREIASALQLSPETVKTYVSRVLRKLGAGNRAEAVARYFSLTTAPAR